MGIYEVLSQSRQATDAFFVQYNSMGRQILDAIHNVFEGLFNALLIVAFALSLLYISMSIYVILKKHRKQEKGTVWTPYVTVQIPTFNELVALRCAESCLNFDYPKEKYEVLIGDDSNKPEISMEIDNFAATRAVKVLRRGENTGYKAGNLNNMLKHSKGEIIVIFDSDFVPPKDFLARIVEPFAKDSSIGGVQARWKFMNSNQNLVSVLGATIVEVFHRITMPFVFSRRRISFLCGSAEAVRKDTLIKLGGWENGNLTEDIEYSLRLMKSGYRIEYMEDLECDSEVPYKPKDLYRQQMRWAYGVVYSYKKHAKSIYSAKKINTEDKLYISLVCSGYLLTILLAGLFITGTMSIVTHKPEPIDLGKFFFFTTRNIAMTGGLIIASLIAVLKAKKANQIAKMLIASFSYGLIVAYHVNIGIYKALLNRPMKWYMLSKGSDQIKNRT
ncbi:glycosyltransferase [Candidatus Woesearchaeota archaeon]|nr:glycosyltransferase [Candidatus Woesearchaeota archaeon]